MEVEREVKELLINEDLPKEIEKLAAEGWMVDMDNPPKAVYHVYRHPRTGDMQLKMHIDDSKIGILRDGKIVE